MTIGDACNSDRFFFYGKNPLAEEIESDLMIGLTERGRGFFYDRQDSAGADRFVNSAPGLGMQINLRFAIAQWVAFRNQYVSAGQSAPDRRAAASQNSINIQIDKFGKAAVEVGYFQYFGPRAGKLQLVVK